VVAICEIPVCNFDSNEFKNKLTLVLDDIQDPGNLGTIIRIADWFGIRNIICSNETADAYNSKVVQATMGSISRVNVYYEDLVSCFINELSAMKMPVYGALLHGENVYSHTLLSEGFIVIGNESRGIAEKLYPFITDKITIPSFSTQMESGEVESLNAAVATAIICSEFRRRK
jgi:TrmH family RNA methyltransferase